LGSHGTGICVGLCVGGLLAGGLLFEDEVAQFLLRLERISRWKRGKAG